MTREEYDAKYDALSRRIQELEDERDALVYLQEAREDYEARLSPEMREFTRAAVAMFTKSNAFLAQLDKEYAADNTFMSGAEWIKPPGPDAPHARD